MRFRNTLLACLVLAGLGVFIYYYEYRGEEARESAKESEKNVFTFERDKVREVVIAKPGSPELTLRLDAGQWRIATPLEARADPDKVSALLSSLSFLRIEQKLDAVAEAELAEFKLKEPQARVTIKLSEAAADLSLSLGDKTAIGGNYYAQRPGAGDVLLVSGDAAQILTADPAALRYKKVVGADVWKVARFKIERGAEAVAFARGAAGDEWRIESPIAFPAEGSKVQGLWFDLQSLEAESFESENPSPEDLRRFGLDAPVLHLTVWIKQEEPEAGGAPGSSVRVAFADPNGGEAVYARRDDMPAVMKIKKDVLEKLGKPLASLSEYREARPAPLDRWKLARVELRRKDGPVTLVKDQESSKWHWGGADGGEMPSEQVNALLDAIEAVKATGFLDGPGATGRAPEEPALTVTLMEGSGETARSVTVKIPARADGGSLSPGMRPVTSTVSSSVYLVPAAAVQTLLDRASELTAPTPGAKDPNATAADPNSAPSTLEEPE
ncbi:MAG TPA: DUF4340 domain-containing protein [Candidatus Polarisedimenticolia bacterium]|jgi:hypothetical protein